MKYIDKGPCKEGAKTQGEAIANGKPLQWPLCLWANTPRFDGRFGCSWPSPPHGRGTSDGMNGGLAIYFFSSTYLAMCAINWQNKGTIPLYHPMGNCKVVKN